MGAIGSAAKLWRYPASSFGGERRSSLVVGAEGVAGDRLFGLVEVANGEPARPDREARWHKVPLVRSRLSEAGGLEIALPGENWIAAPGIECDRRLSALLGFAVSLRPFSSRVAAIGFDGPTTSPRYIEAPLHVLTTASLARLKALHPSARPDPRRFRPNVLIDMPEMQGSFPETEWLGRRIAIGEVELTISEPCRRCAFTIIAQYGFDEDAEILRTLVRNNSRNIGVYCTVDRPGQIGIGARVRFL
jgi:uncharacterized protein YcbX